MSLSHVVMSGKQHEHTQGFIQKIWPIGSSNVTYVIEGDTVVSGRLPILLVIRSKDGLLSYRFRDNRRFFPKKKIKYFDAWRRRSLSLCLYRSHSVSQVRVAFATVATALHCERPCIMFNRGTRHHPLARRHNLCYDCFTLWLWDMGIQQTHVG